MVEDSGKMARPLEDKRLGRVRDRMRSFARREEGVATIEFVLWIPLVMLLLLLTTQVALLFMTEARYGDVARDTARLIARHALDADEAEEYVQTLFGGADLAPAVAVAVSGGRVEVVLSKPAGEIAAMNPLGLADGFEIGAGVIHQMEPE